MKIALVADKSTATCFRLAGLKDVHSVRDAEEAGKRIRTLSEEPSLAIILITERLVDPIRGVIEKIAEQKYPVVVPIPDVRGATTVKTDLIVELIRRKTGIEVKL